MRKYLKKAYHTIVPFLYARTNYKLFLRTTLQDVDESVSRLLCAIDAFPAVINPVPIRAPFGKRMLVIAPHQDDEMIGCGGALLLQKKCGATARVLFVQDGGDEHSQNGLCREAMVRLREEESRRVAAAMGLPEPRFLRHQDLSERTVTTVAQDIRDAIEEYVPDSLFVPFLLDYNVHHQATTFALAEALRDVSGNPKIYGYEVWGLCIPNVIVAIDEVIEKKKSLLALYESQVRWTDYVHCTTGLNMYHSRTFGADGPKFAERFFEIPKKEFVEVVYAMREKRVQANIVEE